jgi:hypothetical protein
MDYRPIDSFSMGYVSRKVILPGKNDCPGIVGEEQVWFPPQRLNSVPCRLLEIQSTPPYGHPALMSALEPILVVIMPGVAETFDCAIDEMTHGTDFQLVN